MRIVTAARVRHFAIVTVAAGFAIATTRDIGYLLGHSFWLDEAWVAVSGRLPLTELTHVTSSTPIGWNFLQRLFAPFGDQAQRLLPLIFAWLASIVAYGLGFYVWAAPRPVRVLNGSLVAIVVTCSPFMVGHTDLKQYTADAFFALLIALLALFVERDRSRGALYALTIVCSLGLFLSLTVAFVAVSAFVALLIDALVRRDRAKAISRVVAGAIAGASILVIYLAVYRRASVGALTQFWAAFYPTIPGLPEYVLSHAVTLTGVDGTSLRWVALVVFVALVIAFVVLTARAKQPVLGVLVTALCIVMVIAGLAQLYPLLDVRTSIFLVVTLSAVAALGAARLAQLLWHRFSASPRREVAIILTIAVLGTAVIAAEARYFRNDQISYEDPQAQISYIRSHWTPGDVIVTDGFGAFSLEYYWPELHGYWIPAPAASTDFSIRFPSASGVFMPTKGVDPTPLLWTLAETRHATTVWFLSTHHSHKPRVGSIDVVATWGARRIPVGTEALYAVDATAIR
jgi:hypothetical protein